ncbi:hypothetical protein [Neptuniibacter sp. 2_MG-2023]|uniref:hypothetical protein n=1 Tax=Neptuniibacter sp. 2_MG-2023 TaxID=3062671 RepID=UPI0026E172EE|nr:hypothetical protein [Neptuniibacter sp. 2_MG-2023]MDO6514051.1 hypothetical protein [Neptuniibacter sp. 2_MG-2023]
MSKIDKELIDPVLEPTSEKAHRVTRAALSGVPALGGALAEAFNSLIEPPMARRKTEWMGQVTEAINELYEKGFVTEQDLQENEKFFTTLVHASNVAIKNHEQEKLDALRNAVLNSALPGAPDDTLQQLFLNLIDSCTSWHIALLKLFQGPEQWAQENNHKFPSWSMGGITTVIESAYPELRGEQDLYRLVWQELYRNGLFNTDGLGTTMTANGMLSKRTTAIGDKFVAFISPPNI